MGIKKYQGRLAVAPKGGEPYTPALFLSKNYKNMAEPTKEEIKDAAVEALQEYFDRQDKEQSERIKQWNEDFKDSLGGPYVLSQK